MSLFGAGLSYDVTYDAVSKFDATKDVQPVFQAIATVVHMSNVGRKEGLLALEEKFACNASPEEKDVAPMVLLVVDGTDPDIVSEILTNTYLANRYEGNEALKQYILMRGTLCIQAGLSPRLIEEMLLSLLPKSLHEDCKDLLEEKKKFWEEEEDRKILERFKSWKQVEIKSEEIKERVQEVEKLVLSLDDRALQRAMRDIENCDMERCAAVFSDEAREFIFSNMSHRLRIATIKELIYIASKTSWREMDDDFLYAAEHVEKVIRRLEAKGEIIIWSK